MKWITRWPFLWAGLALVVLPGLAISATASSGSPNVSGSFRDGPYTATTPDSGSCGNNWAIDLFARQFVISPKNNDGTWTVVEKFNAGRFITLGDGETGSAASPGHCDPDNAGSGGNTHMLREGVSGSFSGSFTLTVDPGFNYTSSQGCNSTEPTSNAPSVDDGCTTKQWVELAFPGAIYNAPGATIHVAHYNLVYKALGQQWIDADTGDTGDIFTSGCC
jgi:hypothetical protein